MGMGNKFASQYANSNVQLPSQTVAGFNANETAAQNSALAGGQAGQQLGGQAAGSLGFLLDPSILSPDSNPYLKQAGDAVANTTMDALTRQALPAIRSGASAANGPYAGGSSREGIAQGLATGEATDNIAGQLSQMYNTSYQNGLGTMLNANQLVPSIQAAQLFGPQVQSAVGGQQRGMEQAQLDASNQTNLLQQLFPLLQAQQLFGLIGGMPGGSTQTTSTGAVPKGSPWQSALGGAATGASIGSAIPGFGTGLGALLGGAGGYVFS